MTLKLHPALSHFPIGFPIAAFVLSGLNLFGVLAVNVAVVSWLIGLGLFAALFSIGTGFWELMRIPDESPAEKTLWWHVGIVSTSMIVFGTALVLELNGLRDLSFYLLLAGSVLVAIGGHFGGMLVYRFKVGIVHEERK